MYWRVGLALPENLAVQLLVVGITLYLVGKGWFWICRRHPLVGWFIFGFLRGSLGRR
jgi:hypothetical protein